MTDPRTCANCACYLEVTLSPLAPPQGQCRRNGPVPAQVRIEMPRMLDNKPVIGKDGKPVVTAEIRAMMLHAPTVKDAVCFDGWRPIKRRPGHLIDDALPTLTAIISQVSSGNSKAATKLAEGMLEDLLDQERPA